MAAVAQPSNQHDVHPLLRHPRPITGDFAKAQRMLGLIVDSEEKSTTLRREKSKTTKWLERPLYEHLDVSDIESEKDEVSEQRRDRKAYDGALDGPPFQHWTASDRPTSFHSDSAVPTAIEPKAKLDTSFTKRRPEPLRSLRPVSYHPQDLLSPQWTTSPATMSPSTQCSRPTSLQAHSRHVSSGSISSLSSSGSVQRVVHPQTWPAQNPQYRTHERTQRPVSYQPPHSAMEQQIASSPSSPHLHEQRPRPISFASYQNRDRRNSKIASSRGLRNNSYPNFSRPNPSSTPKVIPGENIEGGLPQDGLTGTQSGAPSSSFSGFIAEHDLVKEEKKTKNRWSAIPNTLKKFSRRRSSAAAAEPSLVDTVNALRQMNVTDQNLHSYEKQTTNTRTLSIPTSPITKPLPTPAYSPLEYRQPNFEAELPKPFAPWAQAPPSPALSQDKRRSCEVSLSPRRRRASSLLSIENVVESRPESFHSHESGLVMPLPIRHVPIPQPHAMFDPATSPRTGSRRGTPMVERSCIICKTAKEPGDFVTRRISGNCWHEPATCYQCLQAHIERCVRSQGWDRCTCPECGEVMTYEDMGAFADDENSFVKWED